MFFTSLLRLAVRSANADVDVVDDLRFLMKLNVCGVVENDFCEARDFIARPRSPEIV